MTTRALVIDEQYHHLPEGQRWPECIGHTVPKALAALRAVDWGDLGGGMLVLSDGTMIEVVLTPTGDGNSRYMSSQRAVRRDLQLGSVIRTYTIR